jgi:SnoaL-like domain
MKIILPLSIAIAMLGGAAQAQSKLPELKKQPTAQAVLDEHFAALNACDWDRLLAQYPEDAQINLPNGMIVKGRAAIGTLFTGFCTDAAAGGLKGMQFSVEHSTTIGDTFATQWVANAPWLAQPYRGSDAYITKDGYMQAMVSTFDGTALKRK